MNTLHISVVIPTYNCEHFITEAIDSALLQTLPPMEVIVVDDGSRDRTAERLAVYGRRVRYIRQENQGVSAARNRALQEVQGDYVAFLDADDVWHPRKLELQARVCLADPTLALLGTKIVDWPHETFPKLAGYPALGLEPVTWAELVVRNRLITSSILARADLLRVAGPFDTQLQGPEDRDEWLRMARLGPVANLLLPLTGYRSVEGSVSRQAFRCRSSMLKILEKLDRENRWAGERYLRRRAYANVHHSCAYVFSHAGLYREAVLESLKSLAWYPLPAGAGDVESPYERPRRLAINLLRLLRIKPADPAAIRPAPAAGLSPVPLTTGA